MSICVSAPGSMMLLGEHAVLANYPALVSALDRRVKVRIEQRSDDVIEILSSLGCYETSLDSLTLTAPFEYVVSAVRVLKDQLTKGAKILIHSEFEGAIGLGSSTAVVVATVAALLKGLGVSDPNEVFKYSLRAIKAVQAYGSGADVAASVYGGVVEYTKEPYSLKMLTCSMPISLVYSGKKMKTQAVIEFVASRFKGNELELNNIYERIGGTVQEATVALQSQQWTHFYQAVVENQRSMEALGVCDRKLGEIIAYCQSLPGIHAVKISGSGLGDCVVVMGELDRACCPYPVIDVSIEPTGVMYL